MGHISASSQSSIAALKDVLAYGRLTSSPPLPPPSRSGALPIIPIPYPYTYWGGLWVNPEGVGGGGGREHSSSISRVQGNSGALSALKQILHISSSLERLFHSVISNSVETSDPARKINHLGQQLSLVWVSIQALKWMLYS